MESSWKCADPSCNKVNSGDDQSCGQCRLPRAKSDRHQQMPKIGREKTPRRPSAEKFTKVVERRGFTGIGRAGVLAVLGETNPIVKGRGELIAQRIGTKQIGKGIEESTAVCVNARQNIPLGPNHGYIEGKYGVLYTPGPDQRIFSMSSKKNANKNSKNPGVSTSPTHSQKEFVDNQSINHRLSSILHKYNAVTISRVERKENLAGVKYVLEVFLKTEIENLNKAIHRCKKNKVLEKDEKGVLKSLGVQLAITVDAIDWTKLASFYKETSGIVSNVSKINGEDILAILTVDNEKNKKLERRVKKLKIYLSSIVVTLENIENGNDVDKVPDVEESLRKVEECLNQPPVKNKDDEMMIWAKIQIEEMLDVVDSAWNVVQSHSEMGRKLKQIKNPLRLFGSKYSIHEDSNSEDDKSSRDSQVVKKDVEPGRKLNLSVNGESPNEKEFEKSTEAEIAVTKNANLTEADLQQWSFKDLNENTSTPNSSFLVGTEDFHTPEGEVGGFYSSRDTSEEFHSPIDTHNLPSSEHTENLKSTETGHMHVQELKELVQTYTNKPTSLELDGLLNLLDRDQDGWILYEEFEASLTPDLLSSG